MHLMLSYMKMTLKSQLQYKTSFILVFISQFAALFIYYIFINALFDRFGSLQDFSRYEVLLAFATLSTGYALAEILMRGFDRFPRQIISGNFDRLLVRPRNLLLQIMGSDQYFARLSKVMQSLVALVYCMYNLPLVWTWDKIVVLILMIIAAFATFTGVFILSASFCFVTIQGLEIMNLLVDGGREAAQYPMGIYPKEILMFFTFAIPIACANTYPLLYIIGRGSNWYALTPLWSIVFILPCCYIWYFAANKYQSTGS